MKKGAVVAESHSVFNMHKDPFSLFGLPVSLFVHMPTLNERYQALMKDLHPDQFFGADAFMKQSAEHLVAYANQAYKNLQSPIKCAEEALKAKGWKIPDSDQPTTTDKVMLMEMMELQEMVQNGEDIRPFYQDCILNIETALLKGNQEQAEAAFTRLKFIARLLGN